MTSYLVNMNTNFRVRNLGGTSGIRYERKCSCRSWLDHWRHYTRSIRVGCAVVGCANLATHGAHVVSVDRRTDRQWWIAPFCARCNNPSNYEFMYLKRNVILVSVYPHERCQSWKFLAD